jgi:hypothetical protein
MNFFIIFFASSILAFERHVKGTVYESQGVDIPCINYGNQRYIEDYLINGIQYRFETLSMGNVTIKGVFANGTSNETVHSCKSECYLKQDNFSYIECYISFKSVSVGTIRYDVIIIYDILGLYGLPIWAFLIIMVGVIIALIILAIVINHFRKNPQSQPLISRINRVRYV